MKTLQDPSTQDKDLVVNLANAGNFATFHNALKAADLMAAYKGIGPFTLFAPTDAAFAKLPKGELQALLKDRAGLSAIINLHAVRGSLLAKDMKASEAKSVQGATLTFAGTEGAFTVNGAKVSREEIEACNGVIHGIDTVMALRH